MNLAFRFPIIYWNCACLITDSGATEDKSTDYDKVAAAIGKISSYTKIGLININKSNFTFSPDKENNIIWFGLKGVTNVNDKLVEDIINNRPYNSIKDFYYKVKPTKTAMISLIKGGAFDGMMERRKALVWFLWETCDKKSRLTLQNMPGLIRYNILPKEDKYELPYRIYEFNRYLKAVCGKDLYILDERALNFLSEIDCLELTEIVDEKITLNPKVWDKQIYQKYMDIFREWIQSDKENILNKLNFAILKQDWDKYAGKNNLSAWEMETLCFYYHEHELAKVNKNKYGFVDFSKLPEKPIIERVWRHNNIYHLSKICGTCIAKNKDKSTVTILCSDGSTVNVKFRKEYFSLFDKQISEKNLDGTKTVKEKSWFNRGNMICVLGIRQGEEFISKKYSSSQSHQLYKIEAILDNGDLILTSERYKGGEYEEGED